MRFSFAARIRSFGYAINGIIAFIKSEHNAWLHLAATIVVISMGVIFSINAMEWVAISIVMGMVWITEMINTCVEKIMDELTNEKRPSIAFIKDVAAGAVLTAAILAVIVAVFVFGNKILQTFSA